MGKFREGMPVTQDAVTLILFTIDRIKDVLSELEKHQREPDGGDGDLIRSLEEMAQRAGKPAAPAQNTVGTLVPQTLERPLRPGEVPRSTSSSARSARRRARRRSPRPRARSRPKRTTTRRRATRSPTSRSASASIRSNT
jgi:two-component system chemotaxis sensor kinase CheA